MLSFILVLCVGIVVGIINGMAGGASIISFPVLLSLGLNPINAAVTNILGVSSANLFAIRASDSRIRELIGKYKSLIIISTLSSCVGAVLLLSLPSKVFEGAVPYLLLGATFTLLLPTQARAGARHRFIEFITIGASGLYGGYFGPGQGVMVVAALSRDGGRTPRAVNGAKNIIVGATSVISGVIYIFSGRAHWLYVLALFIGSSFGGTLGGKWAHKMSPLFYKILVFTVGILASIWLFNR